MYSRTRGRDPEASATLSSTFDIFRGGDRDGERSGGGGAWRGREDSGTPRERDGGDSWRRGGDRGGDDRAPRDDWRRGGGEQLRACLGICYEHLVIQGTMCVPWCDTFLFAIKSFV